MRIVDGDCEFIEYVRVAVPGQFGDGYENMDAPHSQMLSKWFGKGQTRDRDVRNDKGVLLY